MVEFFLVVERHLGTASDFELGQCKTATDGNRNKLLKVRYVQVVDDQRMAKQATTGTGANQRPNQSWRVRKHCLTRKNTKLT